MFNMEDSSTYMMILNRGIALGLANAKAMALALAEGDINQVRTLIIQTALRRFGPPEPTVASAMEAVNDLETLRRIDERFGDAEGWANLTAGILPG